MIGESAKQAAKTVKTGTRSLEMTKEMWRAVADASSKADALGLAPPIAEGCRLLASRANYYLGEPEDRHGRVRGKLTCKEWVAFQHLVTEFPDASPHLKALAQALGEAGTGQGVIVREKAAPKNQDTQAHQDAKMVCNPDSLGYIIAVINTMVALSDPRILTPEQMAVLEDKTGGLARERIKKIGECVASAKVKMAAMRDTLLKTPGGTPVSLTLHSMESVCVYSLLRSFLATKIRVGDEQTAEKCHRLIKCAVRFFGRMWGANDEVLNEFQ